MSNKPRTVWPFALDSVEHWAYKKNVFSAEECAYIIELGNSLELTAAKTYAKGEDASVRDSQISWINANPDINWIFQRLTANILELNKQFFNFELFGLVEGLQFTKYEAPNGHFEKHVDRALNSMTRKLSITVQLSNEADYEGGDVELHYASEPAILEKSQGTLSVFPSYVLHQVKPVTSGTRYSLVCWVTGPAFK